MQRQYIVGGLVGSGAVLAIAVLLAFVYRHESSEGCKSTLQAVTSPSGLFRAEMTNEVCAWGFGLAANNVSVKVEKLGKGGWFYSIPLEYDGLGDDQGVAAAVMSWYGPNSLVILVHTRDTSGTVVRNSQGLGVTRSYVSLPVP